MNNNILINKTPFIETICRLRNSEEIVVFEKQFSTNAAEEKEVAFFLETEYENESADYPFSAPPFNQAAAVWAAKIIYFGAQLLLFREETAKDINALFPDCKEQRSGSIQLSADICLRFLPSLLHKLKEIDPDDPLIQKMENILLAFPYSAVGYFTEPGKLLLDDSFMNNDCCRTLLVNRVIAKKDRYTATDHGIKPFIDSALGNYQQVFWPGLNL
jgi:hypothetical protein